MARTATISAMKRALYLAQSGRLSRRANNLLFQAKPTTDTEKPPKKILPIEQISRIYALCDLDLNSKCLGILSQYKIPLHFFSYYGRYYGTFQPLNEHLSGKLHVLQAEFYLNDWRRIEIATEVVKAAATNMFRVLLYYLRRTPNPPLKTLESINRLTNLIEALTIPHPIPELLGIEGNIRENYLATFPFLTQVPQNSVFYFTKRTRRPPQDAINALISFGNSLCYAECQEWIYRTALDPTIGFLHEPGERRNALALDIAEIFKPYFVNQLCITMIKKKIIQEKHFHSQKGGIYLTNEGIKKFLEQWEKRLETIIEIQNYHRPIRYRELIKLETHKLMRYLNDPEQFPYKAYRLPSR